MSLTAKIATGVAIALLLGITATLVAQGTRSQPAMPPLPGVPAGEQAVNDARLQLYMALQERRQQDAKQFALQAIGVPQGGWALVVTPRGTAYIVRENGSFTRLEGEGTLFGTIHGARAVGDEPKLRAFNFRFDNWEATPEDFMPAP